MRLRHSLLLLIAVFTVIHFHLLAVYGDRNLAVANKEHAQQLHPDIVELSGSLLDDLLTVTDDDDRHGITSKVSLVMFYRPWDAIAAEDMVPELGKVYYHFAGNDSAVASPRTHEIEDPDVLIYVVTASLLGQASYQIASRLGLQIANSPYFLVINGDDEGDITLLAEYRGIRKASHMIDFVYRIARNAVVLEFRRCKTSSANGTHVVIADPGSSYHIEVIRSCLDDSAHERLRFDEEYVLAGLFRSDDPAFKHNHLTFLKVARAIATKPISVVSIVADDDYYLQTAHSMWNNMLSDAVLNADEILRFSDEQLARIGFQIVLLNQYRYIGKEIPLPYVRTKYSELPENMMVDEQSALLSSTALLDWLDEQHEQQLVYELTAINLYDTIDKGSPLAILFLNMSEYGMTENAALWTFRDLAEYFPEDAFTFVYMDAHNFYSFLSSFISISGGLSSLGTYPTPQVVILDLEGKSHFTCESCCSGNELDGAQALEFLTNYTMGTLKPSMRSREPQPATPYSPVTRLSHNGLVTKLQNHTADGIDVVYFYSRLCGHCRIMQQCFELSVKQLQSNEGSSSMQASAIPDSLAGTGSSQAAWTPRMTFSSMNCDENSMPDVLMQHNVTHVPLLASFRNFGQVSTNGGKPVLKIFDQRGTPSIRHITEWLLEHVS